MELDAGDAVIRPAVSAAVTPATPRPKTARVTATPCGTAADGGTAPRHYRRSHICADAQTHDLLHAAKLLRQS